MQISETRKGEWFLFGNVLLWAVFPVVTKLSLSAISPLFSAAFSVGFAAIFLAIILTVRGKWHELGVRSAWKDMFWSTMLIGVIFYALSFTAVKYTTAGNISIVALMEIFFAFLFLSVLSKHEPLVFSHVAGALLMITGALFVLFQGDFHFNRGDLLMILATMFAPLGNKFQQRVRKQVSSVTLMFFRSIVSALFLFVFAWAQGEYFTGESMKIALPFLLINGILIFGLSKLFWVEAIHRVPITKALSIDTVVPVLTLLFAFFFLKEIPTVWQFLGLVPMSGGVYLLLRK